MTDSIFPFFDTMVEFEEKTVEDLPMFKEISWDFVKNEPVLKAGELLVIEGNEAIKVWVYHAFKTSRFKHIIYSFDYGQSLKDYIGNSNNIELIKADIEQELIDTVAISDYIKGISEITFNAVGDVLDVDITIETIYGRLEVAGINV